MSRTIFFVIGILLTILIGLVVLFGTSAPLISRLWGQPAQVGPDFYNRMGFWLAVILAAFVGGTPFLGWSRARKGWRRYLAITLAITAALTGLAIAVGLHGVPAIIYVAAGAAISFIGVSVLAPLAAKPHAYVVGWPFPYLFYVLGVLA